MRCRNGKNVKSDKRRSVAGVWRRAARRREGLKKRAKRPRRKKQVTHSD